MKKTIIAILALQGLALADTTWTFDKTLASTADSTVSITATVQENKSATYVETGLAKGSVFGRYELDRDLGQAIDFTKDGVYLGVPNGAYTGGSNKLYIGGSNDTDFTIMGYVNYSTLTGEQYFFGTGSNNTEGIGFGLMNGQLNLVAKGKANNILTMEGNPYSIKANTWYHLAVSYDNDTNQASFYVNGDYVGAVTITSASTGNAGHGAAIGASCQDLVNGAVRDDFNGYLAELSIYNKTMTAAEIRSTAGLVVPEPATATLSLLALAGLAVRRRRK